MATATVLRRLETRAATADQLISFLRKEIADIKQFCSSQGESEQAKQLEQENKKLAEEIEVCKQKLIQLEIAHGKKQVSLPSQTSTPMTMTVKPIVEKKAAEKPVEKKKPVQPPQQAVGDTKTTEGAAPAGKAKKQKKPQPPKQPERADDDITRLDLRVGLITKAERHPDADSLYLETVDVGTDTPLTVVSGLAGRIPLEEMQNRPVILLCNLKPAKMRGIISQAMVMCASEPGGRVEVLAPPSGSVPGDKVTIEGQADPAQPDTQLKAKVWEAVAAKLKTRPDLVAGFDGKALIVPGKGAITTSSLAGVPIK